MAGGTLDDRYLRWLYGQVADVKIRRGPQTYWGLLKQLFKTEFTWFVPNDANRAIDGVELRYEWALECAIGHDKDWFDLECSLLEMLIALARRAEFQNGESPEDWFWHFMKNLEFSEFHDTSRYSKNFVTKRVAVVLERRYDRHGNGGIFPIKNSIEDQRKVEIWYQLCTYLLQE